MKTERETGRAPADSGRKEERKKLEVWNGHHQRDKGPHVEETH